MTWHITITTVNNEGTDQTENPCRCGNVRYNTHLYCLAVQAGFYRDAVECLTATQEILVRSSARTKGV